MSVAEWQVLAGLGLLALIPPFLMALWMRARERFEREPLRIVVLAFLFGALIGVPAAWFLNRWLGTAAASYSTIPWSAALLTAVMVAPFVEEALKLSGFGLVTKHCNEPEDTMVYGAAIGLGFASTENLLYAIQALDTGPGVGFAFFSVGLRLISSTILHGATTALVGIGIGLAVFWRRNILGVLPFYLLAVVLHMGYNYLVSLRAVSDSFGLQLLGLGFAIVSVWIVLAFMNWRIRSMDEASEGARAIQEEPAAAEVPPAPAPEAPPAPAPEDRE